MDNAAERVEDFFTILDTQKFRDKDVENILDHDYVFWMGDLNFRLDDMSRTEVERNIRNNNFEALLKNDQLIKCQEEGIIFDDFTEGKITFPPTYNAKNRVPAWCDRILHLVHEDSFENITLSAKQIHYTSHPVYQNSDHKPVTALYEIQSDFKHLKNYVSYIWAADDAEKFGQKGVTLTFKAKSVTVEPGTYRLCYI
ncbi:hypothetical protein KUTeg_009490, partial [Tegillarca granosa]